MCVFELATALGASVGTATTLQVAGTLLGAYGQYQQNIEAGEQQAAQYRAQSIAMDKNRQIAEQNAEIQNQQIREALERGMAEEENMRSRGRKFIATQRAIMGGSGLAISGTNDDILINTAGDIEKDVISIRGNINKETWGLGIQKLGYQNEADEYGVASDNANKAAEDVLASSKKNAMFGALTSVLTSANSLVGSSFFNAGKAVSTASSVPSVFGTSNYAKSLSFNRFLNFGI